MKKENWIWMPHPGHSICAKNCEFSLNTYIGKYIVSTIGELCFHNATGFQDVSIGRKYETMVFHAKKTKNKCCLYQMVTPQELDCQRYNDRGFAYQGHLKMCKKWSKK